VIPVTIVFIGPPSSKDEIFIVLLSSIAVILLTSWTTEAIDYGDKEDASSPKHKNNLKVHYMTYLIPL
jgi:hypothetical protein